MQNVYFSKNLWEERNMVERANIKKNTERVQIKVGSIIYTPVVENNIKKKPQKTHKLLLTQSAYF